MPKDFSLEGMLKSGLIKHGNDPALIVKRLPLGIAAVDELLGGGIPVGRCTELYGPESTGKTLIAQYIAAAVQKSSRPLVLYLDLEQCFDDVWWSQSGVETKNLLVSSPATAEEAIDIMVAMAEGSDELGCIVVDSIPGMIPAVIQDPDKSSEERTVGALARLVSLMYYKLIHILSEKGIILLTLNQMRDNIGGHDELGALPGGKAQRHYSQIILRTARESWITEGKKHVGFYLRLVSRKNKTCSIPDGTEITVPFLALGQLDTITALLEDAEKKQLITKKGPYYYWKEQSYLGKQNLRSFFAENTEEIKDLEDILASASKRL